MINRRNINNNINEMKNIMEGCEISFQIIEEIIKSFLKSTILKVSFDDVLDLYSETIDKLIVETINKEKLKYVGGNIKINYHQDNIEFIIECYFQDEKGTWVKKAGNNNLSVNRFKTQSIEELIRVKHMKFDIEEPKR